MFALVLNCVRNEMTNAYDHTWLNTPVLVGSLKLSSHGLG